MTQTWDTKAYAANAAFVQDLAGGVVDWLAIKPGEQILDLGCGDGKLSQKLVAAGAVVTGADPSGTMVAAARRHGIQADKVAAEALPYANGSFDAVFSNAALHWVRDQNAMMTQVRRVLRPGGRFVAEMGGHGNIAAIRAALIAVLARYGYSDNEHGVNYYPTPDVYARMLVRHGFHVERIALIPRPTPLAESGMVGWLTTFRRGVLAGIPQPLRDQVVVETSELLAHVLRDEEGHWTADYVRLRFIARI